jgi:hypothetical protein
MKSSLTAISRSWEWGWGALYVGWHHPWSFGVIYWGQQHMMNLYLGRTLWTLQVR